MRSRTLALGLLVLGCTRPNPAFDVGDDAPSTGTDADDTTHESDPGNGPDGPTSSVSTGDDDGPGPAVTGSTTTVSTTRVDDDTGPPLESTGDCTNVMVSLEPIADAFIATGFGACGDDNCRSFNSGAAPQGVIEDVGRDFRSFLLMSFDVSELPAPPLSATLTVTVGHDAEFEIAVSEVFFDGWSEGTGTGMQQAKSGEAAWPWSANPDPWTTSDGTGTFELVLADAAELGSTNVPFVVGSHPVTVTLHPDRVQQWLVGRDVVHLVVTHAAGPATVIAFTRESMVSPTLTVTGC